MSKGSVYLSETVPPLCLGSFHTDGETEYWSNIPKLKMGRLCEHFKPAPDELQQLGTILNSARVYVN